MTPADKGALAAMIDDALANDPARRELLEFAKSFVRASDSMAHQWSQGDWRAVLKLVRDLTEKARAAIAKAEGRS